MEAEMQVVYCGPALKETPPGAPKLQMIVARDGNKTIVTLIDPKSGEAETGIAKCNPKDEFNEVVGLRLAFYRAIENLFGHWRTCLEPNARIVWRQFRKEHPLSLDPESVPMGGYPFEGQLYRDGLLVQVGVVRPSAAGGWTEALGKHAKRVLEDGADAIRYALSAIITPATPEDTSEAELPPDEWELSRDKKVQHIKDAPTRRNEGPVVGPGEQEAE